ncbi:NAD(P)/FAD-dependent oxidoreductase [Nocardia cyriacigeorgica]|jgi:cation diffusion facilitator CzcD-associated flavoprotein CzcO|uniref:flavin-containing monooxygenase n=1 Tax=Nocardia cyriacigeorgica TaxID=135487 RepID=UPI0003113E3E|nr:NAD(P)/FAD-dependent oxidoreductase [Nocardia cyriacigeorgica]AVH23587.1 NAD(P)/FAD-dependent oxidoreductase [Nocardia cyriacigeorgica]MBF6396715.1 NAD(P)/FAD-dependent oxidoreductase [Nocardia cyriacigeorgica]MBF6402347.1 NAD(P)/FAD-dependent oxidoreductase [Nocardia cyriacigeorgica]PPJ15189.1 NAD(P)/FAD-dependent oxidoreductase [Nocardia cyriacigeorgica]TLF55742.1 NAD(P)/FAD-dependent oxidoreductase [Nocardia cyriacigeorgica]
MQHPTPQPLDVICVGAGFSGLYVAYQAEQHDWSFAGFETAPDVGGTWYWNTYPGARCDVESIYYSYSFSEELQQEWTWSERFAPQPEILRYLNHVADRFDLRKYFTFNTKVTSGRWLPGEHLWEVTLDSGEVHRCRYLISGAGGLSTPKDFDVPGIENFTGITVSTSRWTIPLDDLAGKRVAVIGTGSSAVQAIPHIAAVAEHLTVFQRTPNYVFPARNAPLAPEDVERVKRDYAAIREECRHSPGGIPDRPVTDKAFDVSDEERLRRYEQAYERSGFQGVGAEFTDLLTDPEANKTATDFFCGKIREIVHDPKTAALLEPRFHPLGAKRSVFGTDYYETFNRPNVSLVSLREQPIETMTGDSIVTSAGNYEVDAIVLGIGFDAFTGPLFGLNLSSQDSGSLQRAWSDGVRTFLGIMTAGFPNFFMIGGPQSPAIVSNVIVTIEQAVDWITDLIEHARAEGVEVIEATPEAQDEWVTICEDVVGKTLYATTDSWYRGSNVVGKPSTFLGYVGGVGKYRRMCTELAHRGYPGVLLDGQTVDRKIGRIDEDID